MISDNPSVLEKRTYYGGKSPLHYAIERCSESIVKFMLKKGADPMRKNKQNETCLQLAHHLSSRGSKYMRIYHSLKDFCAEAGLIGDTSSEENAQPLSLCLRPSEIRRADRKSSICSDTSVSKTPRREPELTVFSSDESPRESPQKLREAFAIKVTDCAGDDTRLMKELN